MFSKKGLALIGLIASVSAIAVLNVGTEHARARKKCVSNKPMGYSKKNTWQETILHSKRNLAELFKTTKYAKTLHFGQWHISPIYRNANFASKFAPEAGKLNFEAVDKGKKVWRKVGYKDETVNKLSMPGRSTVYLSRKIKATKPITKKFYFGSDDGLEIFVNGKTVLKNDVGRGVAPNQDSKEISLKKGENTLIFKVYNIGGGAGFYFSEYPRPGMDKQAMMEVALWNQLKKDFATEQDAQQISWERADNIWTWNNIKSYKNLANAYASKIRGKCAARARKLADNVKDEATLQALRDYYYRVRLAQAVAADLKRVNFTALKDAIADLKAQYGDKYPNGDKYLAVVKKIAPNRAKILKALENADQSAIKQAVEVMTVRRKALLENPAINFDKVLVLKQAGRNRFLQNNWKGNCGLPRSGHNSSIETLDLKNLKLETLYKPSKPNIILDVDLEFDADKMLFSSIGKDNRWHIFEVSADGKKVRQVTKSDKTPIENYDPVYLPSGKIIFASTRCFAGVPCVSGGDKVANTFLMNADGTGVRQLTFEQDHNWNPTVMPESGKVMYTRWEYTDTAHYFTRILMTMNPDGRNQTAYYGSNSYWPNSMFYTRPIPGKGTKFVSIISGHHGTARSGRLIVFDVEKGRHEADGVVQEIPYRGKKVKPEIKDKLVDGVWPQFLNPYPINEKYYLVACKLSPRHKWAIYLVDTFNNMLKLKELPNANLIEPIPFRKTKRPPILADRVDTSKKDATAYIVDIYKGPGLKNIPRGKVKKLRLFAWHYAYSKMGGHNFVAIEGGWEPKRILGTVPVEKDGSAHFKIPANTPIAIQPLDENGRALQIMRSWLVAMPGERLSCIGCHESQSEASITPKTIALMRLPSDITPWKGPVRGVSFVRDIQPVLDKYCVSCHNGVRKDVPNFKDTSRKRNWNQSYIALHPYVRRPGPESDYHLLNPMEYHASTSELVQMLKKGHHGVKLDKDAWNRLYTWIDLNVPCFGTWDETYRGKRTKNNPALKYRAEMLAKYAGIDKSNDPEKIVTKRPKVDQVMPNQEPEKPERLTMKNWPLTADQAKAAQKALGKVEQTFDLGNGVKLKMIKIPAGKFVMGDVDGFLDERKQAIVEIKKPFWIGQFEITNKQYNQFDPKHDSRFIDQQWKDHTLPGYPANRPNQPVIRVSWQDAMKFCEWLSKKTGKKFTLPTEAQWEYAARAGSDKPFWFGDLKTNYAKYANLADASLRKMAVTGVNPQPMRNPTFQHDFIPRDKNVNDGSMLGVEVGKYKPNPWGLYNMIGNVSEWTRSNYKAYPYNAADGRNNLSIKSQKVMRGGSWRDRAKWSRASVRKNYESYQKVFNGGFRVIMQN